MFGLCIYLDISLIYQNRNTMKTINELKLTKYNYTIVQVNKDGSFSQFGHGSVKLENAQKNANYWNKNFHYSGYPEVDFFEVAIINKNN